MKPVVKVIVAEPSLIIRKGLLSVLKKISTLNLEVSEVADVQQLTASLAWHKPDVLIVNPSLAGVVPGVTGKRGAAEGTPEVVAW